MLTSRKNELTAVANGGLFDAVPGDVTDWHDIDRWHEFRAKYHRAQECDAHFEFPLQLDFELNSTCQMKCGFCTHGQQRVTKRQLTFEQFAKVIDEGARYGLVSIKLNYINEPLLVKDLPRYIKYAKSRGVLNVYFATNGLLLTQSMAKQLIAAGVSKIMVSLDATTPETFQAMRGSDRLEQIVKNVLYLIKYRDSLGINWPLVRVNFVKTLINYHEADGFMERWRGVADMIGYQDQVAVPGADQEMLRDKSLDDFKCAFPFKLMVIDAAGDILPCCTFSGRLMPMGNISTSTIKQAWDSFAMRQLKTTHQSGGYRDLSVCSECMGC
jgi:radical SAM protein with 4Fe4S-binding SPASM domain